MSRIIVPEAVRQLILRLNAAGFEAYAVGGCVRDGLLGREPKDWDICTSARPEETQAVFAGERTILTGLRYGTVTVLREGEPYEITTYRTESDYTDHRHPDRVAFVRCLEQDLARRDFTVNAMAADAEGRVTDPFGGREDLEKRIIRCVGVPEERFTEDALRILRGLRFAARYGFTVEKATAQAARRLAPTLSEVAAERLRKELSGLLCSDHAVPLLREFADIVAVVIPELRPMFGLKQFNYHHIYDVWEHTLHTVEQVPLTEQLRLAALLHDVGKPSTRVFDKNLRGHFYGHAAVGAAMTHRLLRRLHYDNETVKTVTTLVELHDRVTLELSDRQLRRLLAQVGEPMLRSLILLGKADCLATGTRTPAMLDAYTAGLMAKVDAMTEDCLSLKTLELKGTDLLTMGIPAGPEIGRILSACLRQVVDQKLPNRHESLVQYAQKIWKKD